jgi:hypothetical protein
LKGQNEMTSAIGLRRAGSLERHRRGEEVLRLRDGGEGLFDSRT